MISAKQLRQVQKLGEKFLVDTVTIRHKTPAAKDASNPFGDDTLGWETSTTTVKGWVVPNLGRAFEQEAAQVVTVGDFELRVPAGTSIDPGDEVTIHGVTYAVVETSTEQTWPEWVRAFLKRIQ